MRQTAAGAVLQYLWRWVQCWGNSVEQWPLQLQLVSMEGHAGVQGYCKRVRGWRTSEWEQSVPQPAMSCACSQRAEEEPA